MERGRRVQQKDRDEQLQKQKQQRKIWRAIQHGLIAKIIVRLGPKRELWISVTHTKTI